MILSSEYYINYPSGVLIVSAPSKIVGFWLHNTKGVFRLTSKIEEHFHQVPLPFSPSREETPLEQLLQKIGPRIMQVVSSFQSGQREIFNFCINGGQWALELVDDCPALAYLIAHQMLQNTAQDEFYETILGILARKRRDLLVEMNWPSEKWVLKLLRKITASQCSVETLNEIQTIIVSKNSNKINVLRHLPSLNGTIVGLLANKELSPYLTNSFFEELAQLSEEDDQACEELVVLYQGDNLFEAVTNGFRFTPLKSLSDLRDLHARFIVWLTSIDSYENLKKIDFPLPPFPKMVIKNKNGEEFGVFPLENGAAVWREGEEMNHCIAGFAYAVVKAKGWLYAYHVKLPNAPPATVMIRSYGQGWFIEEMKGKHNQEVSSDVETWVKDWLARSANS